MAEFNDLATLFGAFDGHSELARIIAQHHSFIGTNSEVGCPILLRSQ